MYSGRYSTEITVGKNMMDKLMAIFYTTLKRISAYCVENIWDYEERLSHALHKMDYFRCPLKIADSGLYNDIQEAIDDYCQDYNLDSRQIDIEELIFV